MSNRDRTGPPKKATGPRDGRGGGRGRNTGEKGAGPKTGGKKGNC
jgi:hypothetical protein